MKRTFQGITEQKFKEIADELKRRSGIVLQGNETTEERHGFRVRVRYDPASSTLEVEMLKKPWWAPQSLIESKVDEFLAGAGASLLKKSDL